MFKEVRQHLPGLSAWIESCYAGQPLLHLGKDTILSCVGVQQGDPLGFALTLHPIIKIMKAEVPTLNLNAWYLPCVGPYLQLSTLLNQMVHQSVYVTNLYCSSPTLQPHRFPLIYPSLRKALPSPIGPPSYCETVLHTRVNKLKETLSVLHDMKDSQLETALLRSCLALPKLSYTCPPQP